VEHDRVYASLNPYQARTLPAIFERMFPADPITPGATELGVVEYLDRALAGIYCDRQETYRLGLKALDAAAQSMIIDDFVAESFDSGSYGFLGGATLSAENSGLPLAIARISVPPTMPRWGPEFKEFLREWQRVGSVRTQPDALPYRENYFDLDPRHRDRSGLGLPVVRLTYDLHPNEHQLAAWMEAKSEEILTRMGAAWTWRGPRFTGVCSSHDLGGLRMGEDPTLSVLSPELAVHDTPGLYAFTGGAFPSCPGINPTLTMLAMACRAADRLVGRLSRGEEPQG
jgi:gluconate 2-dehydrogenase alpha chain